MSAGLAVLDGPHDRIPEIDYAIFRQIVLRRGQVISSGVEVDHDNARKIAQSVSDRHPELMAVLNNAVTNIFPSAAPTLEPRNLIYGNDRLIIELPSIKWSGDEPGSEYHASLNCTVCEDTRNSKLWVKVGCDLEKKDDPEIGQLFDTLMKEFREFYISCSNEHLKFDKVSDKFNFAVDGYRSDDSRLISVYDTFIASPSVQDALLQMAWSEDIFALRKPLEFMGLVNPGADLSADELAQICLDFIGDEENAKGFIQPLSAGPADGVVLIKLNDDETEVIAKAFGYSMKEIDPYITNKVSSALSGRTAALLAVDL